MTSLGDGTVPHSLGLLDNVQTYYVIGEHSALPDHQLVIPAVQLLLQGHVPSLPDTPPVTRAVDDVEALRRQRQAEDDQAVAQAQALVPRLGAMRGAAQVVLPEEKQLADLAFVGHAEPMAAAAAAGASGPTMPGASSGTGVGFVAGAATGAPAAPVAQAQPRPTLQVNICHCAIEDIGTDKAGATDLEVDGIAVGHYMGVMPVFAELALDRAVSASVIPGIKTDGATGDDDDNEVLGLIGQFTQRGLLRGELGRPFFFPDPRDATRLIVVAGMGPVGRFGEPELTVLVREIFWSLGMLGKKHLASVLIGSGSGNLDPETALRAWLRGAALAMANRPDVPKLKELTFVERNAGKAEKVRKMAKNFQQVIHGLGLDINVKPETGIPEDAPDKAPSSKPRTEAKPKNVATRVAIEQQDDFYRFSAMSYDASWPERAIKLNLALVQQANNSLSIQGGEDGARGWGSFLFKYVIPGDVQSRLSSGGAPIVLACDSNVAQIHWELMVAPDSASANVDDCFLGIAPGITRQLRNNFEGIPEPPPPSRRIIRVLVIGDTCYENPLPGAAAEAEEVKEFFLSLPGALAQFGIKVNVDVQWLIGPGQATCIEVFKRLMTQSYDILHYSGHCEFDKKEPMKSGWLFSQGQRLTANELTRVDRVPPFVFSNACESGVTPSRPDLRTPELAPSFAESFFARGVKNFVCTAWPVQDDAAKTFAGGFYATLLGKNDGRQGHMNEAMTAARKAVRGTPGTGLGWAAYQHYGNPYFKIV